MVERLCEALRPLRRQGEGDAALPSVREVGAGRASVPVCLPGGWEAGRCCRCAGGMAAHGCTSDNSFAFKCLTLLVAR